MTPEEIIEGDKILGAFDGLRPGEVTLWGTPDYMTWGSLMHIVKKIEDIELPNQGKFSVHIYGNVCTIEGSQFNPNTVDGINVYSSTSILDTKIESVWSACVQFINWHNSR